MGPGAGPGPGLAPLPPRPPGPGWWPGPGGCNICPLFSSWWVSLNLAILLMEECDCMQSPILAVFSSCSCAFCVLSLDSNFLNYMTYNIFCSSSYLFFCHVYFVVYSLYILCCCCLVQDCFGLLFAPPRPGPPGPPLWEFLVILRDGGRETSEYGLDKLPPMCCKCYFWCKFVLP